MSDPTSSAATLADSGALKAMFGAVHAEMQVSMHDRPEQPIGHAESAVPVLVLTDLNVSPEELVDVQQRLEAIALEFGAHREDPPDDIEQYHFLFAGYRVPGSNSAS